MMKRVKKVMSGMLMMSMLVSGMLTSQVSPAAATSEPEKQSVVVSTCSSISSPLSEIQYKKFMSYLTQEYAPEMKTEWEKAINERQSVQPVFQMKEGTVTFEKAIKIDGKIAGAVGDLKFTPVSPEELQKILDKADLPEGVKVEAYKAADSTDQGAMSVVTVTMDDTNTANAAKVKVGGVQAADDKELNQVSICVTDSSGDENFIVGQKLQNELDQAITNNDSKAINTVLGKMLNNYKQVTEDLKSALSNVKITKK